MSTNTKNRRPYGKKRSYLALIIVIIVMTGSIKSQERTKVAVDYQIAVDELDSILAKSESIRDVRGYICIRSKAANILWSRDPSESRVIFTKLWEKIDKQIDSESFDKEGARIDLLEQLFPKDRTLANKLIAASKSSKVKSNSVFDMLSGTNPETKRLAFLAYRLAEHDPGLAATVLEAGLKENTAPSLALVLSRIRENDPLLANYVASKAIERFPDQSPTLGLFGLGSVVVYLFPYAPSPAISSEVAKSDEDLLQLFMDVGYLTLKRSMEETEENLISVSHLTSQALIVRKFNQALLASILVTLSPRYSTQYFVELNTISTSLIQGVPKQFLSLISNQVAAVRGILGRAEEQEVSDEEIIAAITREDYLSAELQINKIKEEDRNLEFKQ